MCDDCVTGKCYLCDAFEKILKRIDKDGQIHICGSCFSQMESIVGNGEVLEDEEDLEEDGPDIDPSKLH